MSDENKNGIPYFDGPVGPMGFPKFIEDENHAVRPEELIEIIGDGFYETVAKGNKIFVKPKWISIKKLPALYENVLVFSNNNGTDEPKPYSIAKWMGDNWDFINHCLLMPNYGVSLHVEYTINSDDITHWMPLPKPPEKDDE